MATLDGLVETTRRLLYGAATNDRPDFDLNTVTGYTAAGATITVDTATMWKRGDIIEFKTDGLQLLATADGSGSTVAVEVHDGTDATHTTDDEILWRNPEYGRLSIEDAINEVADIWLWPHVWSWHNDTLTWTSGDTTYPLDDFIDDVVRMRQFNLNSQNKFHPFPNTWWEVENQVNSAIATNGGLLRVRRVHDEAAIVYYLAKRRPFIADVTNLSTEIERIIPHGAAALVAEGALMREGVDPTRGKREEGAAARDSRTHTARFFLARNALKALLRSEVPRDHKFVAKHPARTRTW